MKARYSILLSALVLAMILPAAASAWPAANATHRKIEKPRNCHLLTVSTEQGPEQKAQDQANDRPEEDKEPDCD